jgi:hypothetical protein
VRTDGLQKSTLRLVGDGKVENGPALSAYGPLRAGLITTRRTQNHQLTELLNSLEREIAEFNTKYCEAYVTLTIAMDHLAKLCDIIKYTDTTEEDKC